MATPNQTPCKTSYKIRGQCFRFICENKCCQKLGVNPNKRKNKNSDINLIHKRLKGKNIGILQTAVLVSHLNSSRYFIPILDSEEEIKCVTTQKSNPEYNLTLLASVCFTDKDLDGEYDDELADIFSKLCY